MDDRQLVSQFLKQRNSLSFSPIFRCHGQSLMRVAIYLCHNRKEVAEDLVQETWIAAIEKLNSFASRSSLKTWLTGILINKYRDHQRKSTKHEEIFPSLEESKLTGQDLSMDLKNAILRLPIGYREILTLHDIEGFKHQEIATLLDINEGTSKSQLFHARKAMRKLLTEYKSQMMEEERWSNEEQKALDKLSKETFHLDSLKERIEKRLVDRGLINQNNKTSSKMNRTIIQIAASILILVCGYLLGKVNNKSSTNSSDMNNYALFLYENDEFVADDPGSLVNEYSHWAGQLAAQNKLAYAEKLNDLEDYWLGKSSVQNHTRKLTGYFVF